MSIFNLGIFGSVLPLYLCTKFKKNIQKTITPLYPFLGVFTFLAIELFLNQEAIYKSVHDIRYLIVNFIFSFSLALALSVYPSCLLPKLIDSFNLSKTNSTLITLCGGLTLTFLSWQIYSLDKLNPNFSTLIAIALVMTVAILIRSFNFALVSILLLIFISALIDPVFLKFQWKPMLPGFLISFGAYCIYSSSISKKQFPPGKK